MTFLDHVMPFVYGFAIGYFWDPIYKLIKRVIEEFQIARDEWRNPK